MTPEKLGPYRIERSVGRGGMGTVYAGTDVKTGQPAAVKVLSAALAQEEGFRDRFDAEIRSLRSLDHPNIVRLVGFGEDNGHIYYAMELVDGTSLAQELRQRGQFPWRQVVQIGVETARALKHAHDRGIIHRDLKPGNLLLTAEGHIKLSDFGIARIFGGSQLTSTGAVIGTAEYMAPEQADGRRVTLRCDLYSLGAVLYALLAGRPPFTADSMVQVLHKQRFEQHKPLREVVGGVPRELEAIIDDLLKKDPEQRIPDAGVLARRLETLERALSKQGEREAAPTIQLDSHGERTQADAAASAALATESGDRDSDQASLTVADASAVESLGDAALQPTLAATGGDVAAAAAPAQAARRTGPGPLKALLNAVSPGAWMTAFGILAVGLTIWFWVRPPAADPLYERISAFVSTTGVDQWYRVEGDIQNFVRYHADDPRAPELREYLEEIELDRLGRRLTRGARSLAGRQEFGPLERAYLEAVALTETDPQGAARRLQAALDVYRPRADDRRSHQLIALIERRLAQLNQRDHQAADATLPVLRERLDLADELHARDPEAARQIRQGVVDLYADKPWAAEAVGRARAALGGDSSSSTGD
jgi:serine/threonine-protein kinase